MHTEYTPHRRCVACRQSYPQDQLIRVTLTDSGLRLRTDKYQNGRSCYICRNKDCITKAFDKNGFSKSFRRSFGKEELSELKENIINLI